MKEMIKWGAIFPSGDLAAVDVTSGGYPYPDDNNPELFPSKKKAEDYVKTVSGYNLKAVKIRMIIEEEEERMNWTYEKNDPKGWCGDPSRGAVLGRPSYHGDYDFDGKIFLEMIPLDEGGYDRLGTYFGIGDPLFWYHSEEGEIDAMIRAESFDDAKKKILLRYRKAQVLKEENDGQQKNG